MQYLGLLGAAGLLVSLSALYWRLPFLDAKIQRYPADWRTVAVGAVLVAVVRFSVDTPVAMVVAALGGMVGASQGPVVLACVHRLYIKSQQTPGAEDDTSQPGPIGQPWTIGLVPLLYLFPAPTAGFFLLGGVLALWFPVHYVALTLTIAVPPLYWRWTEVDTIVFFAALLGIMVTLAVWPQRPPEPAGLRRKPRLWIVIAAALVVLGFLYLNRYVYHGYGLHRELFRHGSEHQPFVVITFDDGPHPVFTPAVLDILQEKEAPATFFVVGRHAAEHPDIVRRLVEEGHEVGNHSYSHANMLGMSAERQLLEVELAERVIETITGERPLYFRPPRGLYDDSLLDLLSERGYMLALYSLSSRDWIELPVSDIVNNVLRRAKGGDVMLFHDSGDLIRPSGGSRLNTVRALPRIIDGLRERGLIIIGLRELLILEGLLGEDEPQGGPVSPE